MNLPTYRVLVFLSLLLSMQTFNGLLIVYASIKKNLTSQFGISASILGTADFVSFFSRFLGSLYLIMFPILPQKKSLLYFAFIQLIGILCIYSLEYFTFFKQGQLLLGSTILGIGRSSITIPYLLLIQQFSQPKDKSLVSVWSAAAPTGNSAALLFTTLIADKLFIKWNVILLISCLIMLVSVFPVVGIVN